MSVYYHEDFNECTAYNDIAIFERSEDVPDSTATPICLPPKNLKISKLLKAAGAGFTGPDDEEPTHQPKGYQVIEALVMVKRRERRLVVMTPLGTGLCGRKPAYMSIAAAQGDSGGPLFQYNRESRITQIGITSTDYNFTSSDAKSLGRTGSHDHFTDIREYVDWICEKTGVCPPEIKEHHKGHKHKRKKDEHLLAILKVNMTLLSATKYRTKGQQDGSCLKCTGHEILGSRCQVERKLQNLNRKRRKPQYREALVQKNWRTNKSLKSQAPKFSPRRTLVEDVESGSRSYGREQAVKIDGRESAIFQKEMPNLEKC
ncbi:hypothetical protein TELCIR_10813 [Teladorsagia circumcincta]|uniref:Peptidase S1 domain-containing protein n=1 Tax=Teladorsagia circumcincta TaxID=45464 RepID=A0A2G9UB36_TELCI|nr:hypothetical protein TELCIR_10813 [Teladorsagia circumcincta]